MNQASQASTTQSSCLSEPTFTLVDTHRVVDYSDQGLMRWHEAQYEDATVKVSLQWQTLQHTSSKHFPEVKLYSFDAEASCCHYLSVTAFHGSERMDVLCHECERFTTLTATDKNYKPWLALKHFRMSSSVREVYEKLYLWQKVDPLQASFQAAQLVAGAEESLRILSKEFFAKEVK